MTFLDEVKAQSQGKGPQCGVARWLASQTEVTDADIRQGVEAATLAATWRALQKRGFPHAEQSVKRHVRQECACPTS